MTQSTSAPTAFARRLFAAICISLAVSVAIGVLRAPGWPGAPERPMSAPDRIPPG
jgi:hypothetical protein